jgi:hypothetical protein
MFGRSAAKPDLNKSPTKEDAIPDGFKFLLFRSLAEALSGRTPSSGDVQNSVVILNVHILSENIWNVQELDVGPQVLSWDLRYELCLADFES